MTDAAVAFPGAEGFGAGTVGGRGGAIITVTNLDDSGVGSLRWALEQQSGPRTVVFAVNGTIELKSQILIQNPYVTIAGQTAEGDGITISGARIRVKADEVIIRELNFRPGDGPGQEPGDRDGLMIGTTDFQVNNVIVDRNTFTWAVDENIDLQGSMRGITVSNNLIAEGLSKSINPAGEHSKGMLISNWSGTDGAADSQISVLRNLFASNMDRNPEVRAGQEIEIINNYIYNPGKVGDVIGVGGGTNGTLTTSAAIIGNVIDFGPSSTGKVQAPIALEKMGVGSAVYIYDNAVRNAAGDLVEPDQGTLIMNLGGGHHAVSGHSFVGSHVTLLNTGDILAYMMKNVGASANDRDSIDAGILDYVLNGGGRIVNSVADAGGFIESVSVRPAVDSDKDGMPNWFEDLYGFNSRVFDANGDSDKDGYTNIEEYINGLVTGFDTPQTRAMLGLVLSSDIAETVILDARFLDTPRFIVGFDSSNGDRLDISALLRNYSPAIHDVNDFVTYVERDGVGILTLDADGRGNADVARLVATINGVNGLTLEQLFGSALGQGVNVIASNEPVARSSLTGGNENDYLLGTEGKDRMNGGLGADILAGGGGDDIYILENDYDRVIETADDGIDNVLASVSHALTDNVENLALIGTAAINGRGNADANKISGNVAKNVLEGLDGDDQLFGGAGADRLYGGNGNDKLDGGLGDDYAAGGSGDDLYIVDDVGDVVVEATSEGTDRVNSSVSFTLGANVENLTQDGTVNINGTGNDLANKIIGNSGNNILSGLGGDDRISGGLGSDTLYGGLGNDTLDGGAGLDQLFGGAGDDLYLVDATDDAITESADEGIDNVNASASFTLSANVENIALTGTAAINATGNDLANKIIGNAAANRMFGGGGDDQINGGAGDDFISGGSGADRLTGGTGADTFHFAPLDSGLTAATGDIIYDYQAGLDHIDISTLNSRLGDSDFDVSWMATGGLDLAALTASRLMADGGTQAVLISNRSDSFLFIDTDGDRTTAEISITLSRLGAANLFGVSALLTQLDIA